MGPRSSSPRRPELDESGAAMQAASVARTLPEVQSNTLPIPTVDFRRSIPAAAAALPAAQEFSAPAPKMLM